MTTSTASTASTVPHALSWAWRTVVWIVLAVIVLVLAAAVVVPRLGGATPFTVLTGSMRPEYPPGTLVVVKPVAAADIKVGDVITYQLRSGRSSVVTHRVVAAGASTGGTRELSFRTQGDANAVQDEAAVRPEQIRGRLWYSVPHLGRVNQLLTGGQRQIAVTVVAGSLLGYAALMIASSVRDGVVRSRRKGEVAR